MVRKRLNKEHFTVLMKVYLNKGHNKNSEILAENEMKAFNELIESGYVKIVNKSYSYLDISVCAVERVVENCLETMESMFEVGYVSGRIA